MRTFTPAVKALMRERIDRVAAGIAASHGPNCAIEVKGWPDLFYSQTLLLNLVP